MKCIFVTLAVLLGVASAQYIAAPLPYVRQSIEPAPISEVSHDALPYASLAHPAVVNNALREAQYPPEWTNDQYKNPKIAAALARESWFTDKEMPVFDRVAEKIPREQVFKLFKNAGFIQRK